jgi:uncharacterized protein YebE (UPF0316 family)
MDTIIRFLYSPDFFTWVLLPLLIFVARIIDQTLGTLRLIFISKGYKNIAPFLGFFEVIIWVLAVGQIMKNLDNVMCYIAYGGGFALGNYIGMYIEEKLSLGNVVLRIIPSRCSNGLISYLKSKNYHVTVVDTENKEEKVKMIFSVIKRQDVQEVIEQVNKFNPNAFYSIEEVKSVHEGGFPVKSKMLRPLFGVLKSK